MKSEQIGIVQPNTSKGLDMAQTQIQAFQSYPFGYREGQNFSKEGQDVILYPGRIQWTYYSVLELHPVRYGLYLPIYSNPAGIRAKSVVAFYLPGSHKVGEMLADWSTSLVPGAPEIEFRELERYA